jgi:putative transposase
MPFLRSTELRSEVHAYLTGTLRGLECEPLQVGGVEDHVHILCGLSRKISLAEFVKNLKTRSTRIVKGKGHYGFCWQSGYGAFSASQSARGGWYAWCQQRAIHLFPFVVSVSLW